MTELEFLKHDFDQAMMHIYKTAKKELGYNANRFFQLLDSKGGLATAKQLIATDNGTSGFAILFENKRLDLSVEAYVIMPKYKPLFTEYEIEICKERLKQFGYKFQDIV